MKKIIPIILSLFICVSAFIPRNVFAEVNDINDPNTWTTEFTIDQIWNYINNQMQSAEEARGNSEQNKKTMEDLKKAIENMDTSKALEDYFGGIKEDDVEEPPKADGAEEDYRIPTGNTSKKVLAGPRAMAYLASWLLDTAKGMIMFGDPSTSTYIRNKVGGEAGELKYGIDISEIGKGTGIGVLVNPIKIFAYSLVLLIFGITLIEQSVKYEIFTAKGALKIFGRLILAKIIIDISVTVCMYILEIIGQLTVGMLDKIDVTLNIFPNITLKKSDIDIIGPIIDAIVSIVVSIILMLIIGVILVCVSIVVIKLVMRSIELAMLMVISPAFFACLSSDVTKEYFKRFISTFLQVAAQTLFMAIAMAVCSTHFNSEPIEIDDLNKLAIAFINISPSILIAIAMCVMMVKPPKVLTNLVK